MALTACSIAPRSGHAAALGTARRQGPIAVAAAAGPSSSSSSRRPLIVSASGGAGAGAAKRAPLLRPRATNRRAPLAVAAFFSTTSSNPALQRAAVGLDDRGYNAPLRRRGGFGDGGGSSSLTTGDEVIQKTALLLAIMAASAAYTWQLIFTGAVTGGVPAVVGASQVSGIVALVAGLVGLFKPTWAPYTAPVYALAKGVALAGMSAVFELRAPGVAMQAALLTVTTSAAMLAAVRFRWVDVTDRFASAVRGVTGGYFLGMLAVLALGVVGVRMPMLFSGGPVAIAFSLCASALAASNLLLDLAQIDRLSRDRRALPSYMVWYFAQSLMLTLVWMYMEMLKLAALMAGGKNGE